MPSRQYHHISLEKLVQIEEIWEIKNESEETPDFRQDWVQEGIEIYEALITKSVNDEQKSVYYRNLASLYLEFGRSEKMIEGNFARAFRYLQRSAQNSPDKGDTFYHLAFLAEKMTYGKEKWESAAFYVKEALEKGLATEKQIKAWCLLGKAYHELGFLKNAAKCFSKSKELDQDDNFARFRIKYSKNEQEKGTFARLKQDGTRVNNRVERDSWIEKSKRGECYVLEIARRGTILHGNNLSVVLNVREAELLRLFFESGEGLTKYDIIRNTMDSIDDKKAQSVKTNIFRLRTVFNKELGVNGKELIQVVGDRPDQKYIWNPAFEKHLIEL
jgi:tetratricopeptide (TPR) repeat protein